jgi:Piwi domain
MFEAHILKGSGFRYSPSDPTCVHADKLRGLIRFGPYRTLELVPRVGFVFPEGYRDYANNLFLALKNGVGYFKGLLSLFKVRFETDQVFPITGFRIENPHDHVECAQRYRDAITEWRDGKRQEADIFLNLHPRSLAWEDDSAYASCKAVLLEEGIISQNVTFELMDSPSQFEWAVANIALAIFVKLGGIPWITNLQTVPRSIIIGAGKIEEMDQVSRERSRFMAFTTCVRDDGIYELTSIGKVCSERKGFLTDLRETVRQSAKTVIDSAPEIKNVVIHFPKDFNREERSVIEQCIQSLGGKGLNLYFLKVAEEERFFAFDDTTNGAPPRGMCIKLGPNESIL